MTSRPRIHGHLLAATALFTATVAGAQVPNEFAVLLDRPLFDRHLERAATELTRSGFFDSAQRGVDQVIARWQGAAVLLLGMGDVLTEELAR